MLHFINERGVTPGNFQESVKTIVSDMFKPMIPDDYLPYVKTKEELIKDILGKSMSSVRPYPESLKRANEDSFPPVGDKECKDILIEELNSINQKLFSRPSVPLEKEISYAKFEGQITKYVYYRPHGVIEVKFNKINRVMNWTAADDEIVLFRRDGTSSDLSPEFSGTINIDKDSEFIGFGIRSKPTALVSSSRIHVLTRTSALKEPITSAFPACKIEVDGKEIILRSGHNIDIPNGYKILGV
jgi:hypothetical protein